MRRSRLAPLRSTSPDGDAKADFPVNSLARLTFSHALVLIVAILAGNTYWSSQRSITESLISTFAHQPLADASNLAFRFGTSEHATILLEELSHVPSDPALAAGDEMATQLHLAALTGEYQTDAPDSPHIKSASVACQRFRTSNCDPVRMKELATRFAQQLRH
jgi:hypothetical protein